MTGAIFIRKCNQNEAPDIHDNDSTTDVSLRLRNMANMSAKDEKRRPVATTEMEMVRWVMGESLLEHRGKEEILEVGPMAIVRRMRRLEWFEHVR